MATGGVVEASSDASVDGQHDFTCSLCSEARASHYCPECDAYYCKVCLCDHAVIGRSEIHRWGEKLVVSEDNISGNDESLSSEEECLWHPGQKLTVYCDKHDVVCCAACLELEHSLCGEAIKDIEVAAEIHLTIENDNIELQQDVDDLLEQVQVMEEEQTSQRTTLIENKQKLHKKLAKYKQDINKSLDTLQDKSLSLLNSHVSYCDTRLKACRQMYDGLKTRLRQLSTSGRTVKNNPSRLFVHLKKSEQMLADNKKVLSDVQREVLFDRFDFTFLSDIEETLAGLDGLARMTLLDCPYVVRNKQDIPLKREKEEITDVTHICQMQNGHIIIILDNRTIHHYDGNYSFINAQLHKSECTAVCQGDKNTFLVTDYKYLFDSTIHMYVYNVVDLCSLYNFSLKSQTPSTYSTGTCKLCMVHTGNSLLLTEKTRILEYDVDGTYIGTLYTGQQELSDICFSPDGSRIYVLEIGTGLISLNKQGEILSTYKMNIFFQDRTNRSRLSVDYGGNIFVSTEKSIVQINTNGDSKVAEILLSAHGIGTPTVICFDKRRSKLMIGTMTTNIFNVLDLEQKWR